MREPEPSRWRIWALLVSAVVILAVAGFWFQKRYARRSKLDEHFKRGHELNQLLNRPSDAIVELKKALAIDPEDWRVQSELGLAYLALDQLSEAIGHLETALVSVPSDKVGALQLRLGTAYRRRHEANGADSDFLRAQTNFAGASDVPELEAEANYHLGMLFLQQSKMNPARALTYLQKTATHSDFEKIAEVREIIARLEQIVEKR